MEVRLRFGDIGFLLQLECDLELDAALTPFLERAGREADCVVSVRMAPLCPEPEPSARREGSEQGREYLSLPDGTILCLTGRGGANWGFARCTPDLRQIRLTVSARNSTLTVLRLFHYFPMRRIFQRFGLIFLHAAQIALAGKGLLFTAPSGTGKTTQAKLWLRYRNARLLCNDRTLLRKTCGVWHTYGFPIDGSEPIGSGEIMPLAGLVALHQAEDNRVERLPPSKAVAFLMEQTVFDVWSAEEKAAALQSLLSLTEEIPIYSLYCTADLRAVTCLEERLRRDGILP